VNDSLILATAVRITRPVLFLFAVVLFLKGHNAPGGGFIAGLVTAVAVLLGLLVHGHGNRKTGRPTFLYVVAAGLGLALLTAIVPTLLGWPFFTHSFGFINLPLLGSIELASAALFDLGVYIVVVGNVVTVLHALTERR